MKKYTLLLIFTQTLLVSISGKTTENITIVISDYLEQSSVTNTLSKVGDYIPSFADIKTISYAEIQATAGNGLRRVVNAVTPLAWAKIAGNGLLNTAYNILPFNYNNLGGPINIDDDWLDIDANSIAAVTATEEVNAKEVDAPVVDAPIVDAPIVAEQKVDAPIVAEQKVAAPVVAEQKVAAPVVAEQKVAAPVVAEQKVAAPVVAAPIVAEQKVAAPVVAAQQLSPGPFFTASKVTGALILSTTTLVIGKMWVDPYAEKFVDNHVIPYLLKINFLKNSKKLIRTTLLTVVVPGLYTSVGAIIGGFIGTAFEKK